MVDLGLDRRDAKWVCPSDRQLALRAKLNAGWSMKGYDMTQLGQRPDSLDEEELEILKEAVIKANEFDSKELERIRNLVWAVKRLQRSAVGNGDTECGLCGETLSNFFGARGQVCDDCEKKYCGKCIVLRRNKGKQQDLICKICYETKEMWKKTGAWFTRGLPLNTLIVEEPNLDPKAPKWYNGRQADCPINQSEDDWLRLQFTLPRNRRQQSRRRISNFSGIYRHQNGCTVS